MSRKAKQARQPHKVAGWRWWQGMAAGVLLTVSPGAALLLLALGAPIILALVGENVPGRPLTRTVALFTAAGSVETLRLFLLGPHDLATSVELLARLGSLPLAWTAAATGWLSNEAACVTARWITDLRVARRQRAVEGVLAALRTEWSLPDG
ncbi:hypothetical protein [Lichenicoccus sp.]|uniref:hypothetical protein n=1 Tax=Lichenicoccus sp. TaxID=2781899 RepID=UPI003D141CD1